ncbi:hypothetical protein AbraIFM66951_007448 [Aspergillus brasiliensis]|uniref:Uncharacterized protein n=1 Tax=Aspergillus brasiliensis TaxID=319629 RepID=A0A9W5YTZ5_9EURO|nr:hypothetical protein AbraCBS73388_008213 [Aspergillus brasiliensis]GKZ45069.1 hypothetical protein AbraIFM66951_007448 [Aspergillus brasiliensis]
MPLTLPLLPRHVPSSLPYLLVALLLLTTLATANVEKTIFLAPPPTTIPTPHPPIDDLGLARLSPSHPILRTHLNASFPTQSSPGTESWFFLQNLTPGRRYEVRICWLATQPTSFTLTTYTLPHALSDTYLLSSITNYSSSRLASTPDSELNLDFDSSPSSNINPETPLDSNEPITDSVLFLRIRAAADYFTTDKELMTHVPPVAVDVILDPFLGNVFPRSLVPTACYGVIVAGVAILVGKWVVGELGRVVDDMAEEREKEEEGDEDVDVDGEVVVDGVREGKKVR